MAPRSSNGAKHVSTKKVSSLNPLTHEHIPPAVLPNLAAYKYSGLDKSIFSNYIMCYYWTAMVELLPMWVAPNLVTLIGFIISISSTALVLCFDAMDTAFFSGSLRGDVPVGEFPGWVWVYASVALFAYQTLDAIDGKQARRTKSGSPLGELFDHGCDAFFTPLLQVNICVALGLGAGSVEQFVFFLTVTSGLLFAIWEQYVTGTLDFGYITGPTEGILLTCYAFLLTATRGVHFWNATSLPGGVVVDWIIPTSRLSTAVPDLHVYIGTWGAVLYYFVILAAGATALTNIAHVIARPRVATHSRGVSITSLFPNAVLLALVIAYFKTFPVLVAQAPFLLESCYGFFASYTATRLTVSRLCVMPYRPLSFFFITSVFVLATPLVVQYAGALDLTAPSYNSLLIGSLVILLSTGVLCYLHLMVSVFRQFADHLGIHIFKLKRQKP